MRIAFPTLAVFLVLVSAGCDSTNAPDPPPATTPPITVTSYTPSPQPPAPLTDGGEEQRRYTPSSGIPGVNGEFPGYWLE